MFRCALIILTLLPLVTYAQSCYTLDEGKGLNLFSPFLGSSPRVQKKYSEYFFGDTSRNFSCNGSRRKSVIGVYEIPKEEPVFAAHAGIVSIYTSVGITEQNQANDALWIDGGNLTTNYIGLIPSVQTGQYIYAGQLLGRIYRDKFASIFGFGIRRAPTYNPIHKRGYLPVMPDENSKCECGSEPVWPEHFVNPASKFIAYDRYNDFLPDASLKITIEPGGIGKWSFDNGITWLSSGDKISGLPYGYYKIIFKSEYGYEAPSYIQIKSTNVNKDFTTTVKYVPDYTILKKPEAELLRAADRHLIDVKMQYALDSLNDILTANDKTALIRNSIIDSLNNRFTKIEEIQKETFFVTRLFKYILPILLLAFLFTIILFYQNNKIRRQKRYLENLQKEQHHRVHNSLALVSSLLNKYKNNIDPEKLANIDNSIIAISTVHRQLYKGSDLENVNFQPILTHIAQSLLAQKDLDNSIAININAEVMIPQKKSTILALMFNELFTNSLKYAFEDIDTKEITLTVTQLKEQLLFLYRDNGNGYNADFLTQETNGFGRVLLEGLANQLRAKINFYNESGACCMIKLQ